MSDTLAQDRFPMPEPFFGAHQFRLKLIEIGSTKVLEFASLEQIPHSLLWIEFRSVARQSLQMDTFGAACCQKVFDDLRAMNARAIPDDQQFAWDLAQEQLQELHHIRPFERMILDVHDQTPIHRETTHGRQMITGQRHGQHRCLSHRSVGPHGHWQQVKARLIYKDDGAFLLGGLFFISTEWWSRQTWMACALRWVARVSGFCRLCLMAARRREQWVG